MHVAPSCSGSTRSAAAVALLVLGSLHAACAAALLADSERNVGVANLQDLIAAIHEVNAKGNVNTSQPWRVWLSAGTYGPLEAPLVVDAPLALTAIAPGSVVLDCQGAASNALVVRSGGFSLQVRGSGAGTMRPPPLPEDCNGAGCGGPPAELNMLTTLGIAAGCSRVRGQALYGHCGTALQHLSSHVTASPPRPLHYDDTLRAYAAAGRHGEGLYGHPTAPRLATRGPICTLPGAKDGHIARLHLHKQRRQGGRCAPQGYDVPYSITQRTYRARWQAGGGGGVAETAWAVGVVSGWLAGPPAEDRGV